MSNYIAFLKLVIVVVFLNFLIIFIEIKKLNNAIKLYNNGEARLMYIYNKKTDCHTSRNLLDYYIRSMHRFFTAVKLGICRLIEPENFFFDIDDSHSIVDAIRTAHNKNKNLLIVLDSDGGCAVASDNILSAFRTFQLRGGEITCLVHSYAESAATMIALASDFLYVDTFGKFSPCDPQYTDDENSEQTFPCAFYNDLLEESDENKMEHCVKYLTAREQQLYYIENISTFEKLTLIKKLNKKQKTRAKHLFCSGTYSHSHPISFDDLIDMGIEVNKPTDHHYAIMRTFDIYKNYFHL